MITESTKFVLKTGNLDILLADKAVDLCNNPDWPKGLQMPFNADLEDTGHCIM